MLVTINRISSSFSHHFSSSSSKFSPSFAYSVELVVYNSSICSSNSFTLFSNASHFILYLLSSALFYPYFGSSITTRPFLPSLFVLIGYLSGSLFSPLSHSSAVKAAASALQSG